jgi:hypothetical protein
MWHPLCHSCYKPGDVTNTLPTFLIRDVTRFVTRVAQWVPQVLILLTFLIRDVTRFATRLTTGATGAKVGRISTCGTHCATLVTNLVTSRMRKVGRVSTCDIRLCLSFLLSSFVTCHQVCNKSDNVCHMFLPFLLSSFVTCHQVCNKSDNWCHMCLSCHSCYKPGDVTNEESRKGKHMWHPLCHSCY